MFSRSQYITSLKLDGVKYVVRKVSLEMKKRKGKYKQIFRTNAKFSGKIVFRIPFERNCHVSVRK